MTATASSTSGTLDEHVRGGVIGGVRILAGLLWLANLHLEGAARLR